MGDPVRKACAGAIRLLAAELNTELSSGLFLWTFRKLNALPLARGESKFIRTTPFYGPSTKQNANVFYAIERRTTGFHHLEGAAQTLPIKDSFCEQVKLSESVHRVHGGWEFYDSKTEYFAECAQLSQIVRIANQIRPDSLFLR